MIKLEVRTSMKVGFIGLGNMGKPLADRLLINNELFVYDLDQKKLEYFTNKGAISCSTPSELASTTSIIFLCLFNKLRFYAKLKNISIK